MSSLDTVKPLEAAHARVLERPQWSTRCGLLEICVEFEDGRWLLELSGELDLSNVTTLEDELRMAEASLAERIVVDLERLRFIDSSGLHALLRAARRSRRNGGRLRVIPGPRAVQSVFRLTRTEHELPFEETPAEA